MKNETELKNLAHELFDPELANEVAALIDSEVSSTKHANVGVVSFGLTTLFLGDQFYSSLGFGRYTTYCDIRIGDGKNKYKFLQNDKKPFSFISTKYGEITPATIDFDGCLLVIIRGIKRLVLKNLPSF